MTPDTSSTSLASSSSQTSLSRDGLRDITVQPPSVKHALLSHRARSSERKRPPPLPIRPRSSSPSRRPSLPLNTGPPVSSSALSLSSSPTELRIHPFGPMKPYVDPSTYEALTREFCDQYAADIRFRPALKAMQQRMQRGTLYVIPNAVGLSLGTMTVLRYAML